MDWETIAGSGGRLTISFQNNLIIAPYHFLFSHSVHWDIDLEMEVVVCDWWLVGGRQFYVLKVWVEDWGWENFIDTF